MIEISDWADEILHKASAAARRFNPDVHIRLAQSDGGVKAVLAERPEPTDTPVHLRDMTLYVEQGLTGLVDIEEPHDHLVLRPPGSAPNVRTH